MPDASLVHNPTGFFYTLFFMVKVLITTDPRYPVNRKVIRNAVIEVIDREKILEINTEVSVSVVGSRKMKFLSKKYLGDEKKHEVLSFGLEELGPSDGEAIGKKEFVTAPDEVLRLGDVVLCWPEVLLCAAKDDVMVDEEVSKLVSHGVEHLLGKQHD